MWQNLIEPIKFSSSPGSLNSHKTEISIHDINAGHAGVAFIPYSSTIQHNSSTHGIHADGDSLRTQLEFGWN